MKTMKRNLIHLIGRTIMLAIFAAITAGACFGQTSDGGGRLSGTWDAIVTARNCTTGDALASFQSTVSFNQGGTFSGISSGRPPTLRTPELGVWKHVKANQYSYHWKAYLFNATGQATGYQTVTQDVELADDGLNWISSGISQAFTLDGVLTGTGCSTIVGSRMADL